MKKKERLKGMSIVDLLNARKGQTVFIGIDPGVRTGIAVWVSPEKSLDDVTTKSLPEAMEYVRAVEAKYSNGKGYKIVVVIEDARKRQKFNRGAEGYQGAGSIKRDSKVWAEFCDMQKIPFFLKPPAAALTGSDSNTFFDVTGWDLPTSKHSRDAGMLVYGL